VSPDVNLGAIKVLGKSVAVVGIAVDGYQMFTAKTHQERSVAAQSTAVNGFGAAFPEAALFTSIPYDLGQMAAEQYVLWKREQEAKENAEAEKLLEEAALCHGSNSH